MILRIHAAVIAHLHESCVVRIGVHPMIAFELFDDALDRGFHTERTSAFYAFEWIFTVQRHLLERLLAKTQLWFECDRLFWAGVSA